MCVKSKTVTFIDEESRMMVGVQERRKRGDAGQGYKVSVMQEEVLKPYWIAR